MIVDIIYIGSIEIYLARNVRPIFQIYSSIVNDWYGYESITIIIIIRPYFNV